MDEILESEKVVILKYQNKENQEINKPNQVTSEKKEKFIWKSWNTNDTYTKQSARHTIKKMHLIY